MRDASSAISLRVADGGSVSFTVSVSNPFRTRTGTSAGVATVSGFAHVVLQRIGTSAGLGVAVGRASALIEKTGTSAGAGAATGSAIPIVEKTGAAAGVGAASGAAIPIVEKTGTSAGAATVSGVVVFEPADLFGVGDEGIFHDFSDKTSLFQDITGPTTAVTASGQPVGYANDLGSGNNNTAAPFTSARGTYTESGGLAGLVIGAASGERLEAANASGVTGLTNVDECTMMVAYTSHSDANSPPLRLGSIAADYAEVRQDARLGSIRDNPNTGSSITVDNASSADTSGAAFVYGGIKEGTEGRWYRWNSAGGGLAETDTGLSTFAADFSANIALRGNGSTIYAVFFIDRALSTAEFEALRDWMRGKAGH